MQEKFRIEKKRTPELTFHATGDAIASMEASKDDSTTDETTWNDLVEWVQGGAKEESSNNLSGYVHPALTLRGTGPSRGVKATAPIAKGELLIRISSDRVLSGATETIGDDDTGKAPASPWLKCVGAFLKAKRNRNQQGDGNSLPLNYTPYLNSLPTLNEYETLHNWSTESNEIESFLKGTTLGNLVSLDRSTKGIQTRYRNSVEPYLIKVGAIDNRNVAHEKKKNIGDIDGIETSADYRSFLEASMCISTRGFHLLPTTTPTEPTAATTKSYDGPFLLPIIDLLNHDPQRACTTLKRHQSNETTTRSYFAMVAERNIADGEEIFHSYGSEMTSAQLLQTFGFVPRNHSTEALAAATSDPPKVAQFSTPVGLSARDHLVAASRALKASSFPDTVMDRIRAQSKDSTEGDDGYDDDDSFWEVCDIPDRFKMASNDTFLVSSSQARGNNNESLLTEDIVTLMTAQFLPQDAFEEIFPTRENTSNEVQLDLSILTEDYYLGMLVCKSLLVAFFLKARDYCADNGGEEDKEKSGTAESTDFVAKAISGATPSGVVREYISTLIEKEASRIRQRLDTVESARAATTTLREIYGCTIRIEELTNLCAFCKEIEGLMAELSLDDNCYGDEGTDNDPPHKRARLELS